MKLDFDSKMAKNSLRWNTLLQLTTLLSQGKAVLEELVATQEDDLEFVESPFSKKRKRYSSGGSGGNHALAFHTNPKNKPPKHQLYMDGHVIINNNNNNNNIQTSYLMQQCLRRRIIKTEGSSAVCVIEKALFATDVDGSQCRLSVPLRQVSARFLLPGEVERLLSRGGIQTTLIQPSLKECEITFGLWVSNTTYVLKNGWRKVCELNNLREGMVVRLWAFRRSKSSDLCFALEKRS